MILGGYARDLTRRELRGAVARLALRPDVWSPLVRHDAEERFYEEIFRDEHLSAWLICWMPGQETELHDHAGSAGAVTVVSGAILEQRLAPLGDLVGNVYSRGERLRLRRRASSTACATTAPRPPRRSMRTRPRSTAWAPTSSATGGCSAKTSPETTSASTAEASATLPPLAISTSLI